MITQQIISTVSVRKTISVSFTTSYHWLFQMYIVHTLLLYNYIKIMRILLVDALVSERCSHLLLTD